MLNRRPSKVSEIEVAIEDIRVLTAGGSVSRAGAEVSLPWADGGVVPVYVAAYGPRMLNLAGRVSDGVIIECGDPYFLRWAIDQVHAGAREAGREVSDVAVICSVPTFVSGDLDVARAQVRPFGGVVGNHVAEVLRNLGTASLPTELEAFIENRPDDYDYRHHGDQQSDQSNYVADDMLDRLSIVGPPERCAARLRELEALGVTHVNFYFYGTDQEFAEQMEIYSREVLPLVRGVA